MTTQWKSITSISAPTYGLSLLKSGPCANGHLFRVVLHSAHDGVIHPNRDLLEDKLFHSSEAARNYFEDTLYNLRKAA